MQDKLETVVLGLQGQYWNIWSIKHSRKDILSIEKIINQDYKNFSFFINIETCPFWKWRHNGINGIVIYLFSTWENRRKGLYSKLSLRLLFLLLGYICSNYFFSRKIEFCGWMFSSFPGACYFVSPTCVEEVKLALKESTFVPTPSRMM